MDKLNSIIKTLPVILPARGRIKIGEKGSVIRSKTGKEFQPPKKLDYFRITTLERGPDGNFLPDTTVHKLYGDKPREIPIRLVYDDLSLNLRSQYMCMNGKTLWCYGDGEAALRLREDGGRDKVTCPCGRQAPTYSQPDKCKIHTVLSVWIDGVDAVGGVYEFRTSSYNSTVGLVGSLSLIQRITHGVLAGLPLMLVLRPKTVVAPDTGATQTIWVVGVEYRGSIEQLHNTALEVASQRMSHAMRIEQLEEHARKLLDASAPLVTEEDVSDVVEEFYPEVAVQSTQSEAKEPEVIEVREEKQPPQPPPPTKPKKPASTTEKKQRRATHKFEVNPEEFSGMTSITTCGITPEQMIMLREIGKERPELKQDIVDITGGGRLSLLTSEEATELIAKYTAIDVSDIQDEDKREESEQAEIECPNSGKMVRVRDCHTKCKIRAEFGYCPAVDGLPHVEV